MHWQVQILKNRQIRPKRLTKLSFMLTLVLRGVFGQSSMESDNLAFLGENVRFEYAKRADGTMPAKEYLESLSEEDQVIIQRSWNYLDGNPNWRHPQKFKQLKGHENLYEFKAYQSRLYASWNTNTVDRRRVLLLCGNPSPKKKDKARPEDLVRAVNFRSEHVRHWEEWETKI